MNPYKKQQSLAAALLRLRQGPIPCPPLRDLPAAAHAAIWAAIPDGEIRLPGGGLTARGMVAMLEAARPHAPGLAGEIDEAIPQILAAGRHYTALQN